MKWVNENLSSSSTAIAMCSERLTVTYASLHGILSAIDAKLRSVIAPGESVLLDAPRANAASYALLLACMEMDACVLLSDDGILLQDGERGDRTNVIITVLDLTGRRLTRVDAIDVFDAVFYVYRSEANDVPYPTGIGFSTSGSTGRSKIALHSAESSFAFAAVARRQFDFGGETRTLISSSVSWDVIVVQLLATLAAGGTACIGPDLGHNPLAVGQFIRKQNVNTLVASQFIFTVIQRCIGADTCAALQAVVFSGERVHSRRLLKSVLPGVRFYNEYGCSEAHDLLSIELTEKMLAQPEIPIGVLWPETVLEEVKSALRKEKSLAVCHNISVVAAKTPLLMENYLGERPEDKMKFYVLPDYIGRNQADDLYYTYGRVEEGVPPERTIDKHLLLCHANHMLDQERPNAFHLTAMNYRGRIHFLAYEMIDAEVVTEIVMEMQRKFTAIEIARSYWLMKRSPRTRHGKLDVREVQAHPGKYAEEINIS